MQKTGTTVVNYRYQENKKNTWNSNAISIAQSKFEPTLKPYAIYFKEIVVGFLMYNSVQEELDGYWVYRIMVDKEFQGKGIGKAATKLMISEMVKLPNSKKLLWVIILKIWEHIIYTRVWDLLIMVIGSVRKWQLLRI